MNPAPRPLPLFLLASDLGPTGAARQLSLLAAGLPRERFAATVGVLGPANTPAAAALRRANVAVHSLPIRTPLDIRGMRALRRAVAAADPAVVHAWGAPAAGAAGLVAAGRRVVVSAAADPGDGLCGWLAARRLRRADRVVAASGADDERYCRLGVEPDRLALIAPAVVPAPAAPDRAAFLHSLGLPPDARLIVTAGRFDAGGGLKAAIWAFDFLRYEFTNLYLVICGGGPDRAGLEAFGRALAFDDFRVVFPGVRADLPAVLGLAEAVWVVQEKGGVNLALEAMAAGRPVVAFRSPDLAGVVGDGATGFLTNPAERPQVSARTHELLTDPALGPRLGAAGAERAAGHFEVGRMVAEYARLYEELASGAKPTRREGWA